jgi:subtilisin family serine protease
MKKIVSYFLLTSGFWITAEVSLVVAQTNPANELFYNYYNRRIPLNQRQDKIAVAFKGGVRTRGTNLPLYLQLQQDLQVTGTRGEKPPKVEVTPLGERYAVVSLHRATRGASNQVQQLLQKQAYVETTLPVLTRQERKEEIILPNEVIVSFDAKISDSQKQAILKQQKLEIIRPLRFNPNRYLVKSQTVSGTAVLNVANQLDKTKGVQSATPNFIQPRTVQIPTKVKSVANPLGNFPIKATKVPFKTVFLPLQWHLDSVPLTFCLTQVKSQPFVDCITKRSYHSAKSSANRADIRATEAWGKTNQGGKGVVVAVLDSVIQWDHPDLIDNLYFTSNVKDKLPGEERGWDFADNDADTRISKDELARVTPSFQDSFRLDDAKLLANYSARVNAIKQDTPNASDEQIASFLRESLRMNAAGLFHGTWVSGVIAARPQGDKGVLGVAPNAQILPVSVGKEAPNTAAIVEGIGYAAARGADVINMSWTYSLPVQEIAEAIVQVQQQKPNLVFVAAAGNSKQSEVGFPATLKGVISVGATNLTGKLAPYSNFGKGLDMVAPGGDTSSNELGNAGGILTTGGTWVDGFWQGIKAPDSSWGAALDSQGRYLWVDGTSFAAPTVAGVVALMKGENTSLSRDRAIALLKQTASYQGLNLSGEDNKFYQSQVQRGIVPKSVTVQQYYFGSGLVNADVAVREVMKK